MSLGLFDVVIAGAGPSGSTCAFHLAKSGCKIALVDKANFPRNKICGDGLTGYTLFELNEMGRNILDEFLSLNKIYPINGVRLYGPDTNYIEFQNVFRNKFTDKFCYVCKRCDFDDFLFRKLKSFDNISFFENFKVQNIETSKNNIKVYNDASSITAKVLVGADGANSMVSRKLLNYKPIWKHNCLAVQCYYENIKPHEKRNTVEVFFLRETLPGYLWIFPGKDNFYNVGMGLIAGDVRTEKTDIKQLFINIINKYSFLQEKFHNAARISKLNTSLIPLGSYKRKMSGERFVITGDAASLTNPFSGEGIAYGMNSGRIAANHIINCLNKNDFSSSMMKQYDKAINKKLRRKLNISYRFQKFAKNPKIINKVIGKVQRNEKLKKTIEMMLKNPSKYKNFFNPVFYYRFIFR